MPKPWLKLWASSLDSEKIQSLSGDQTKTWIKLLMIALRFDRDGELPPLPSIAFQARISIDQAAKDIEEMVSLGMIEKRRSLYVVHDWTHWQGEGLSDADRKARQRAKLRDMSRDTNGDCHGTENEDVTGESQPRGRAELREDEETKTRQDKEAPRRGKASATPFLPPEWVSLQDWQDYESMRRTIRKPMTDRARREAVAELAKLRAQGNSPNDVLRQSILNSWQGLWPIKSNAANGKPASDGPIALDPVALAKAQAAEKAKGEELLRQYRERIAREKREKGASAP